MATPHSHEGDLVRDRLLAAFARDDRREVVNLCMLFQSTILAHFASWTVVPEAIRGDPAAVERYVRTLMFTADIFRSLGHPELLDSMVGKGNNPISRWQEQLSTATELSEAGEYERSTALLRKILQEMDGVTGTAVDELRPKILGFLGTNALHLGDIAAAQGYVEGARADCERIGDRAGVRIYRENLQVIRAFQARAGMPGAATGLTPLLAEIAAAQDLSDNGNYRRSNSKLHKLWLDLTRGHEQGQEQEQEQEQEQAQVGQDYLAKIYGLMGSNYFKLHDAQLARDFMEMALHECERLGDDYGASIYASNLEVISRASAAESHEP